MGRAGVFHISRTESIQWRGNMQFARSNTIPSRNCCITWPAHTRSITGVGRGNAPADASVKAQPGNLWDDVPLTLSNGCPESKAQFDKISNYE